MWARLFSRYVFLYMKIRIKNSAIEIIRKENTIFQTFRLIIIIYSYFVVIMFLGNNKFDSCIESFFLCEDETFDKFQLEFCLLEFHGTDREKRINPLLIL